MTPSDEPVAVDADRDSEHVADHGDRQRKREVADQVDCALVLHTVDEVIHDRLDPRSHRLHLPPPEGLAEDLADPRVLGAIEMDQIAAVGRVVLVQKRQLLAGLRGKAVEQGDHTTHAREPRVAMYGVDVLVARQEPRLKRVAPVDGIVLA